MSDERDDWEIHVAYHPADHIGSGPSPNCPACQRRFIAMLNGVRFDKAAKKWYWNG